MKLLILLFPLILISCGGGGSSSSSGSGQVQTQNTVKTWEFHQVSPDVYDDSYLHFTVKITCNNQDCSIEGEIMQPWSLSLTNNIIANVSGEFTCENTSDCYAEINIGGESCDPVFINIEADQLTGFYQDDKKISYIYDVDKQDYLDKKAEKTDLGNDCLDFTNMQASDL